MEKNQKALAIYHEVKRKEDFEKSANVLFTLVKNAQEKHPNQKRVLYLDIEGHKNKKGGFDDDMFELQKDFIPGFLMKYISEVSMPLGKLINNNQLNDIPDILNITAAEDN